MFSLWKGWRWRKKKERAELKRTICSNLIFKKQPAQQPVIRNAVHCPYRHGILESPLLVLYNILAQVQKALVLFEGEWCYPSELCAGLVHFIPSCLVVKRCRSCPDFNMNVFFPAPFPMSFDCWILADGRWKEISFVNEKPCQVMILADGRWKENPFVNEKPCQVTILPKILRCLAAHTRPPKNQTILVIFYYIQWVLLVLLSRKAQVCVLTHLVCVFRAWVTDRQPLPGRAKKPQRPCRMLHWSGARLLFLHLSEWTAALSGQRKPRRPDMASQPELKAAAL